MKRIIVALLLTAATVASAGLQPDTFTFSWTRQGTTGYADTNVYLSDTTYLLTNCAVMSGTNVQDLTSCGIVVRVGDATTNRAFVGFVQTPATGGLFGCYITIPQKSISQAQSAIMTTGVQLTITNGSVSVTDREQKQLYYSVPLK